MSESKYTSEAGHWYTQTGTPMYTVVGKNGKERNTTLADAKKLNLVPSVTTVLSLLAKPGLENWKMSQTIYSCMELDKEEDESLEDYLIRIKHHSSLIGKEASERGTEVHAMIEQGFVSDIVTEPYEVVKDWLDEHYPNEVWIAEDSFCAKQGYGGKIDLYSQSGIFVDFKTKDNLEGKDPKRLVYDEHGMQLSAYAQGCGFDTAERVSIFVDRSETGVIACHVWDEESHSKHTDMFNYLLNYWKLVKNYNSELRVENE